MHSKSCLLICAALMAWTVYAWAAESQEVKGPQIASVHGCRIPLKAYEERLLKQYGNPVIKEKIYEAVVLEEFKRRQQAKPGAWVITDDQVDARVQLLKRQLQARTAGKVSWEESLRAMGMDEDAMRQRVLLELAAELMLRKDRGLTDAELISPEENASWYRAIRRKVKVFHHGSSTVDVQAQKNIEGLRAGELARLTWLPGPTGEPKETVITRGEVLEKIYRQLPEGRKTAIQDELVNETLIRTLAEEKGIKVSAGDIMKRFKEMEQDFRLDPENEGKDFTTEMKKQGRSLVGMLGDKQTKLELLWRKLVEATVSEEDVRRFYDESRQLRRVAHILSSTVDLRTGRPKSEDGVQDAEERIRLVEKKLQDGEDFETLAMAYSDDLRTRENGGEVGPIRRNMPIDPAFLEHAFALKKDEISEPFRTALGWHIIRVLDDQDADAPDYDDPKIHDMLRRQVVSTRMPEYLHEQRQNAQIERNELP